MDCYFIFLWMEKRRFVLQRYWLSKCIADNQKTDQKRNKKRYRTSENSRYRELEGLNKYETNGGTVIRKINKTCSSTDALTAYCCKHTANDVE